MDDLAERLQRALGDGYEISDDLGGGMARVFVVREVALNRHIVVKVLPPAGRSSWRRGCSIRTSCRFFLRARKTISFTTRCRASKARRFAHA
jgi:hypothetical protein